MSRPPPPPGQDFANVPYQARQRRAPTRAPPPPPKEDEDDPTEIEDVQTTADFEDAQGFTSPPSPPRPSASSLPPPPPPTNISAETTSSGAQKSAAHLHPHVTQLPTNTQETPLTLTPLRAHYLKKTLVALQLSHELGLITDPVLGANALGLLGDPFILPDAAKQEALKRVSEVARAEGSIGDLPFMRFLFHQFILPFPFLSSAPPTFWSAKVQPFLSNFLSTTGMVQKSTLSREEQIMAESLMSKEERKEAQERAKLWNKVEKHAALMVGVGIKIAGGEEVVRIGQSELRRMENEREARKREWFAKQHAAYLAAGATETGGYANAGGEVVPGAPPPPGQEAPMNVAFEVNVVGVRVVMEKGRVRSKSHEEFLIRTRRSGVQDVYVSRRYGDFKRLSDEIRMAFPDYMLPSPPPKDKTVTTTTPVPTAQYSYYNPLRMVYGNSPQPSGTPSSAPTPQSSNFVSDLYNALPNSATSNSSQGSQPPQAPIPLSREKNRLTLRAYLQSIIAFPDVINSPVLRSFLLSAPTQLTPAEAQDSQRRLEADAVREEGRRRFREEAEKRIEALREGLTQFKGDVLSKEGGLKKVFEVVRRVERVEDLPKAEASVLEWGRISLAATIFQTFVASDTGSDQLANLKRLHGMVPYFVLKGILRISNPMAMIRGVLDLFLARPFGGQSLIQRMFSSSLNEEVRLLSEDIAMVSDRIEDPVICQKIEHYAMAPYEIQEIYRKDAVSEGVELLVIILRSPEMPTLSRPQLQRCFKASRAYKAYKVAQEDMEDSDDDLGPEDEDAWLFEDLNVLLKLWQRRREKEALLALIFEGVTAELLKDIITIFYAPLAQVYKAASIADSVGDLQNFLNDMIRTVEQVEELSQEDPQRTVQTFIDLVQRHEQAFYTFVHNVHSKGQGLFDSLMSWIELFLSYARDGLPHPVDLEFILPHAGPERAAIMREVDAVAQYHYRLKLAHEEKIRKRFDKSLGGANAAGAGPDGQDDEEAALMGSVMASLNLDESTMEGAMEDEESDEDDDDEEEEEDEDHDDLKHDQIHLQPPPAISTRSSSEKRSSRPNSLVGPVPEHFGDSLSPPPTASTKKERSGSSASTKSNLEKIRQGLTSRIPGHGRSPSVDSDSGHGTPRTRVSPRLQPKKVKMTKRRRARLALDSEKPPEVKAVEELRPLFMEVIKPLLAVKPLKP